MHVVHFVQTSVSEMLSASVVTFAGMIQTHSSGVLLENAK